LFIHVAAFLYLVDLVLDLLVAFLQGVSLGVEHVHVVEQAVVLLFSLDERSNNLLDVVDSGRLLDLVESVFNDSDVPDVLVHELFLLLVGGNDLVESELENVDWVGVIANLVFVLGRRVALIERLVIKLDHVVLLAEPLHKLLDGLIEAGGFLLMLGLERNNLSGSILRDLVPDDLLLVGLHNFFLRLLNVFRKLFHLV